VADGTRNSDVVLAHLNQRAYDWDSDVPDTWEHGDYWLLYDATDASDYADVIGIMAVCPYQLHPHQHAFLFRDIGASHVVDGEFENLDGLDARKDGCPFVGRIVNSKWEGGIQYGGTANS